VGAGHTGPGRGAPGPLAREHDVPEATGVGPRVADAHRAGHVGAIPVDDAAEVEHDELAGLDATRGRARVRLRTVGTGRDDRLEAVATRAALAHRELQAQRNLLLRGRVAQ